ncbi:PEP-CTERM sorting domain-containing protein [Oxalobacteraceae bacterium]|nr:PEP-CTERM sorting domain-containing protein [Oxalobacteraceae bacterium]
MKTIISIALSLLTSLAFSAAAYAQPGAAPCGTGTPLSTGYLDCAGAFSGNLGGTLSAAQIGQINAAFADQGFTYNSSMSYLKSDVSGNGLFTDDGSDLSLNFATAQTGLFVIGLKQSTYYSFYLVDGGSTGISTINVSSSGVFTGGNGLSHAIFVGAVPEANTYAMLLAGLGLVGVAVRRRKAG